MRILVLGGTRFLGRHVVDSALASGHSVTLFNRGQTRPDLFPDVERLRGDRDGDLSALVGRGFDAVVDTSGYVPRIVERTLDALGDVRHYSFVSSISAYADLSGPPHEGDPVATLAEPTENPQSEAYGALKALCEQVVLERYPAAFVPRPGLIVGPWDNTGRFTYWPERVDRGGAVLVAGPPERGVQVIHARDLADWIVLAAETGLGGTFNAIGPVTPMAEVFETCRSVAGSDARPVWVDQAFLVEHGVEEWMELPLWIHDPAYTGMLAAPADRAVAAGLRTRPLADTVTDTLAWVRSGEAPDDAPAGLDPAKEQQVLAAWEAR